VLTPSNPSVPVLDESLLADIPAETEILRARTWEPGYSFKKGASTRSKDPSSIWSAPRRWAKLAALEIAKTVLQPDPQVLWYRNAIKAATTLLTKTPRDAIICTAPPFSSFLIGQTLKRRFGVPLVLDYRDEWDVTSLYKENVPHDWFSRFVQEREQRMLLRSADAIIATTQASLDRLGERLAEIGHSPRRVCIYNGFDLEDFERFASAEQPPAQPFSRFRLVYTGTLWNLTNIEPLVHAAVDLHRAHPERARKLELVCVGRKTPEQQHILERVATTGCTLTNLEYCEHARVLSWLRSSDALCLLLADVPGAERVVPAKLFEYLAARKDLLAIVPDGEAARIVERFHPDGRFRPTDIIGIRGWLADRLERGSAPSGVALGTDIDEFSRERQTARLLELLDTLTGTSGGSGGRASPGARASSHRYAESA
jgi:glycosyltransferase involved in cell wall biosynthesis